MHTRVLILPLIGALALLGAAVPAYAAPVRNTPVPAAASPSIVTHAAAGSSASRERALEAYWTPQRMRDAIPASAPTNSAPSALPKATVAGPQILARPTGPTSLSPSPKSVRPDALSTPVTQGRVFFTDPGTGTNYSCTGGTINNPGHDMVITAGHCVYQSGRWMTNWIYVPAYYNGPTNWGTWFENDMTTFTQWTSSANPNYDFAIVNVAPASTGATLVGTTGGNGLEWNEPYVRNVVIWGYPIAYNNGLTPEYCVTTSFQSGALVGAPCNMTEGASGGPWLDGYNATTGTGYEFAENSTRSIPPADVYSPYFGSNVSSLYADTATL